MENNIHLQQAIWQEFSSQYLPEELPPEWGEVFVEQELPKMAQSSASRLKQKLEFGSVQDLIELLDDSSQNPDHSLIQLISDATLIDWPEEPRNWEVLQKLLHLISVNLKQSSAT